MDAFFALQVLFPALKPRDFNDLRAFCFTKTPREAWGSEKLIAIHMIGKLLLL